MANRYKAILLIILTGISLMLTSTIFALEIMLKKKKQQVRVLKQEKRTHTIKAETDKQTWSRTLKNSSPLPSSDLLANLREEPFHSQSVSADAHLALALGEMPFELNGNAIPPKLFRGEYGNGRGMMFVQDRKDGGSTSTSTSNANSVGAKKEAQPQAQKEGNSRKKRNKEEYKSAWTFIQSYMKTKTDSSTHGHQGDRQVNATATHPKRTRNQAAALHHLEMAAELGNSDAQNILANILASGILPFEDYPELRQSGEHGPLDVQADFAEGGQQLARAIILWHMSAMDGNIEAALTLGYRHFVSATSGSEATQLITEGMLKKFQVSGISSDESSTTKSSDKKSIKEKVIMHSPLASAHYGVLGTCETSLAYYEAAANAIMDELETGPLRGKVSPAHDHHKLAEIYQRGASSKLAYHNKPDELGEAMKYYKMRANNPQNPDTNTAYKLANMYHYGLKGVKQDMKEALKYYEIAGNQNSWEASGQAGKFHLWGMGVEGEERNLKKSVDYFRKGTPGGIIGCKRLFNKNLAMKEKNVDAEGWSFGADGTSSNCDHPSVNGMGLLHLYGVPMLVPTNLTMAIEYFDLAQKMGNMDASFNLAMMKLGWMNAFYGTSFDYAKKKNMHGEMRSIAPTKSEYIEAIHLLKRADAMGHIQAKHRLAMLYSRGVTVSGADVIPKNCQIALKLNKEIAMAGTTISKRMRAAYKQYMAGDYEASLRNYVAAAETGSVEAQVNAAFLFEQGFCLGMNRLNCMKASVRMWRAAARQGDEEACLRVGDFYYYGRLREDIANDHMFTGVTQRDIDYSMAPLPWVRYILYPEDLLPKAKKFGIKATRWMLSKFGKRKNNTLEQLEEEGFCSSEPSNESQPTCAHASDVSSGLEKEQRDHFGIAAHYYRKAADDHESARANFNLGFMHEWGLGLTQDFPLAKRFYDIAAASKSGEGELAVQIALACMNIHELLVRTAVSIEQWYIAQTSSKSNQDIEIHRSIIIDGSRTTTKDIIIHHIFAGDTALILILALILTRLIQNRLERRRR